MSIRENLLIFTAVCFILLNHFWGYQGHFGADDMHYAKLASEVVAGKYHLGNDHYYYRWGLIFPLALSYRAFGVNDFSSALPAMIYTALTTLVVLHWLRMVGWRAQVMGVTLLLTCNWTIFYSDKIMPDCGVAFFTVLCFYLYLRAITRGTNGNETAMKYALYFSVSFFGGLLCKETIVLLVPVFLVLIICNWYVSGSHRFWLGSLFFLFTLFTVYMGVCRWATGNPLSRLELHKGIEVSQAHSLKLAPHVD